MKFIAMALLGALTACSGASVKSKPTVASVADPRASFDSYRTFSFGLAGQPKPGFEVTPRSLDVARRLRPLVLDALRSHGYTDGDTQGDLIVKLSTGTGNEATHGARGGVVTAARGFIGIDIFDSQTGAQVWQGMAFAEIDPEKIDDSLLQMGVTHMLAGFPARAADSVASAP